MSSIVLKWLNFGGGVFMEGDAVSPCTTPDLIIKSLNITRAYWRFRLGGSTFGENIFAPPPKKKTPYHEKILTL